jgi:hypothetical protein
MYLAKGLILGTPPVEQPSKPCFVEGLKLGAEVASQIMVGLLHCIDG